jgi:formate dehydrogenase iron-sulfur subunit
MTTTVYVPIDATARSLGADEVAAAIAREAAARGESVTIVRNGTRGLCWLEPLVEVATPAGRVAYGPVDAADVPELFAAGLPPRRRPPPGPRPHRGHPVLQESVARVGLGDPLSLDDYAANGGLRGLRAALSAGTGSDIVEEVVRSGLRGRGGAAFPAGIKWRTVLGAAGRRRSTSLQRRRGRLGHLQRPHADGGRPVPADRGHGDRRPRGRRDRGLHLPALRVPHAERTCCRDRRARERGWLGDDVLGSGKRFDSSCGAGPAPTSAARRPRCSRASRASAASCAPSRRCRRSGPVRQADGHQQRDHAWRACR